MTDLNKMLYQQLTTLLQKFDEQYKWNIGESDVSRPPSVAASAVGTPVSTSSNPLNQVHSLIILYHIHCFGNQMRIRF